MSKSRKIILLFIGIMIFIIIMLLLMLINIKNTQINSNTIQKPSGITSNNIQLNKNISNEPSEDMMDTHENMVDYTEELVDRLDYFAVNKCISQYLELTSGSKEKSLFAALKIQKTDEGRIRYYKVYGLNVNQKDYSLIRELNLIVYIDTQNLTFFIEQIDNNLANQQLKKIEAIDETSNNSFTYPIITDEDICRDFLNTYKIVVVAKPEIIYNYLDSEYKSKRFGTLEEFKKYVKENEYSIINSTLKKYKVTRYDNYTQYNCIDNFGNYYFFKETELMKYTIVLDNYTIMLEDELEYYNELDKFEKSKYNLTKFIKMINTKDYSAIYKVLDNTFKVNNFATVETLGNYLKNNLYDLNSIEIEEYDDETYAYYVFTCKITNMANVNENKNMTVIINQDDGIGFTMSFSIE